MEIFRLLDSSDAVLSYKILDFKLWTTGSYLKMEISIRKGTFLYVREYIDESERNYSFHWQDSQGNLIARWDNSPHHSQLKTFPHHMHKNDTVVESTDISLEDVMKYIENHVLGTIEPRSDPGYE